MVNSGSSRRRSSGSGSDSGCGSGTVIPGIVVQGSGSEVVPPFAAKHG